MIDATWTNPRKLRAVFSYRVATRRYCLSRSMNHSTSLRSLMGHGRFDQTHLGIPGLPRQRRGRGPVVLEPARAQGPDDGHLAPTGADPPPLRAPLRQPASSRDED